MKATRFDFLAPAQADDELGRLGAYRVLKVLGQGGMGVVFLAEDLRLGRVVALKAMLPNLAEMPGARERFLREAKAIAALEHDHIVAIFQVDEERGVPFLAMPLLKGISLEAYLKQREQGVDGPPLSLANILRIGREIATGLTAAHVRGLVHRDIKPGNIWLDATAQGRVKLLDFGLARAAAADGPTLTPSNAIVGTPAYMAPEQAQGKKVDARADLFSLGVVLYRLCTGVLPFAGPDIFAFLAALIAHEPPPPRDVKPDVPQPLSDLVMKLLVKDPQQRTGSAQEVVNEIRAMEKNLAAGPRAVNPAGCPTTVTLPASPGAAALHTTWLVHRPRRWWPVVAACTLLIALPLAVFIATTVRRPSGGAGVPPTKPGPVSDMTVSPKDPPRLVLPAFRNKLGMDFVLVSKGTAWLGGGGRKPGDRKVEIPHDFYLGVYAVTQGEWRDLMGDNPSWFSRNGKRKDAVRGIPDADLQRFPVENVSWSDAQKFIQQLNAWEQNRGWAYRLPTEVEWEYACRGGPISKEESAFGFYLDHPANDLSSSQANFDGNFPAGNAAKGQFLGRTTKVGSYEPNRLGIYDMHGNVWQWCEDSWGSARVLRGGSWDSHAYFCRAAYRNEGAPSARNGGLGFRLARVPSGK